MVKHHIFTLLTASLLSLNLYAAAPVLGPEVPLVPGLEPRADAYGQGSPAAASNGIDHLVVWEDGRRLSHDIRWHALRRQAGGPHSTDEEESRGRSRHLGRRT